jgi:hypothetical protein
LAEAVQKLDCGPFSGVSKPLPDPKQIGYSEFYEVVFADTSLRAEFLHSFGRTETFATG